jgi:hypothetical protein
MKAKLVGSMPVGARIYEIKFDGYRALALRAGGETRILPRNEKDLGGKFPAVRDSIAALDVQDVIIDGEMLPWTRKDVLLFNCSKTSPKRRRHRLGSAMAQRNPKIAAFYLLKVIRRCAIFHVSLGFAQLPGQFVRIPGERFPPSVKDTMDRPFHRLVPYQVPAYCSLLERFYQVSYFKNVTYAATCVS